MDVINVAQRLPDQLRQRLARLPWRQPSQDRGFDRRLILPMALGAVLNPINSTMLAVALVPIGAALGAPASQTAWLVSGLYLATAVGQPVTGRLIDLYGPRRLFLAGATLVSAGGLLGALTPSIWLPVIVRVVLAGYLRGLPGRDVDDPPRGRAYRPRQPGGHPDAARGLHPDHRDHRIEPGRADRHRRLAGHFRRQRSHSRWRV